VHFFRLTKRGEGVNLWKFRRGRKEIGMADLLQVTDETFEAEIMKSEIPAMVDFWRNGADPAGWLVLRLKN